MDSLKKKILVVDDDEVLRDILINFLKSNGYEAIGAKDGQKGLNLILVDQPDLIITGIHIPIMNGFQLLRAVKKLHPEPPVIFITSFPHFRRFYADKTARADGFLEKPFSLEAIDNLVKKLI